MTPALLLFSRIVAWLAMVWGAAVAAWGVVRIGRATPMQAFAIGRALRLPLAVALVSAAWIVATWGAK